MARPTFSSGLNDYYYQQMYDEYMKSIEQYRGTEYYEQLVNNPYMKRQDYGYNLFQDAWYNTTGDDSAWVNHFNGLKQSANEYMSQILGQKHTEAHNTTAAQVARDQAAGLNPAISGQTTENGQTSPVAPDDTPPVSPVSDPLESISNLGNIMGSFFNGIVSFAGSLQSLGIANLQQNQGFADLASSMYDYVLGEEAGSLPIPSRNPDGSLDFAGVSDVTLDAIRKRSTGSPFRKGSEADKMYKRMRGTVLYDKEGKPSTALQRAWMDQVAKHSGDVVTTAKNYSQPGYNSEDLFKFAGVLGSKVTDLEIKSRGLENDLKELERELKLAGLPAAQAKGNYEAEYYSGDLAQAEAGDIIDETQTRALERKVRRLKAQYNENIETFWKDFSVTVKGDGAWYNNAGLMLLPGVRSAIDEVGQRFLDHVDNLLDMAMNPLGQITKRAGDIFSKKLFGAPGAKPVPRGGIQK